MSIASEAPTSTSAQDTEAQSKTDFIASHRGKHVAITAESIPAARDVAIAHWQLGLMERRWLVVMSATESPFVPTEHLKS
ncbi:hypothetical protein VPH13_13945 [Stenotrophomonas pavanii]|uniref:hypothetical protein n=1 Tax=Stenotrophomonas pavanii TaxID=487698 RepID=UPI002DB61BF1|nr:hypothetical protein [Stenotrophomonas pavanii]MEC4339823.1 hypothetical protein [Stenotrophomonas pavanii]